MKKGLLLVLVLVLALSLGGFAFQNEPEGFRDLKWGDPPSEAMKYLNDLGGSKNYTLPEDKMSIGSAEFWMITYQFYEGRFFLVSLYFDGEDNYDLLETICKERYGEEIDSGFYQLSWWGQNTSISLYHDIVEEGGFLILYSTAQ